LWPVGPFPDRNLALDHFNNSTARQEEIGPFTFEETSDFLPHYNLVEQDPPNGPETLHPLYQKNPDLGLGFQADTPLPLRASHHPGGAVSQAASEVFPPMPPPMSERPSGTTVITAAPEVPPSGTSVLVGGGTVPSGGAATGGAPAAGVTDKLPPIPVQSYLVTTPLGLADAVLISLTLRFDDALHNVLASTASELLIAEFDGWELEPLATGDALLERLAQGDTGLRAAIIQALDDRAAVLQFSDPTPFRLPDLKRIKEGIVAFSRLKPRTALVGVITFGACIILIQVSWGVGLGLSATAEYAVTEVGKVLVDGLTARLREPNTR
jgi:hypothetical protein